MNTYIAIGRLVNDPISRTTSTGKKIVEITLAINSWQKDKEEAFFIECCAWEGLAGIIEQYTKKGQKIAITGALTTNNNKTLCVLKSVELL